jgi:acetate kinase
MSGCIAVINAGSSSVKFAIYEPGNVIALYRGQIEGIGTAPVLRIVDAHAEIVAESTMQGDDFDHAMATREILGAGQRLMQGRVGAIGHRVVHGGRSYAAPMMVTSELLDDLAKFIPLAPLHQPHNLAPIRAIMAAAPRCHRWFVSIQRSIAHNRTSLRPPFAVNRQM